jgi:hypothetical protein
LRKYFFTALIFFLAFKSEAQISKHLFVQNFEWKNAKDKVFATINIFSSQKLEIITKKIPVVYFLEMENDSAKSNSILNNVSAQFKDSILPFLLVRISFKTDSFYLADSLKSNNVEIMSVATFSEIEPEIISAFHKIIDKKNVFVTGINDGALAALYAARIYKNEIKSAGLFFDNYIFSQNNISRLNLFDPTNKYNKLFFYSYGNIAQQNSMESFTDSLGLLSNIMMYKVDENEEVKPVNIFNEFYQWITANGNNYIIKTD